MTAKALLARKTLPPSRGHTVRVNPPKVDVRVDAPHVTVDTRELAQVVSSMAATLTALSRNQAALLDSFAATNRRLEEALQALDKLSGKIAAPRPAAPRPRAFSVEFAKEDGETVGLRITPDTGH